MLVRLHRHRRLWHACRGAQLDPPDGGLRAAGDPPAREGCRLEILIDGAEALPRISAALDAARSEVNIAGWHITPDFGLDRDEGERGEPATHRLLEYHGVSRRSAALLGPLQGFVVDG